VTLIGNLGKDVEMRFTPSGSPVATFSIATNRKFKDKSGELKEQVDWFSIVAWNKTAELCNQFLQKGSSVFIVGRLSNRSWDGQDGQKRYRTEIIANQVIFMGGKKSGGNSNADEAPIGDEDGGDITIQDIPF